MTTTAAPMPPTVVPAVGAAEQRVAPRRACVLGGAALLVAIVARLILGPPHVGYDAWFALSWGDEIAHGGMPSLDVRVAPTPHPLLNAVGALLAPLGHTAPGWLGALHFLAFGAAIVAAYLVARRIAGPIAGVIAALLLATRPLLISELLFCSVDVPFLAIVLAAGAVAIGPARRQRERLVVALLVVAGLLRPEAWALAAAYGAWLAHRGESRLLIATAFGAAPVLWGLTDLAATGDALWSLHQTRALADRLGRPQSLETAVRQFPESVSAVVGSSIAVVGTVAAVGIARRPGAARLPLAVLAASYAGWLVLGIAGLPLLLRYAMLPGAAMLVAAAASGPLVAGWVRGRSRSAAAVVWLISGAAVATQLADATSAIRQQVRGGELQLAMERDLDAVLVDPRVRALVARCGAPTVPHYRPVPQIAYRLGVPADRPLVAAGDMSPVLLDPIPSRASAAYRLSPIDRDAFAADAILGTRLVMANGHWAVRERCTVR